MKETAALPNFQYARKTTQKLITSKATGQTQQHSNAQQNTAKLGMNKAKQGKTKLK
jgi:phosphate starvation-inducible protein PhoH